MPTPMGGVAAVAAAIMAAITTLSGVSCSIAGVMMMQAVMMASSQNAVYTVLVKLI